MRSAFSSLFFDKYFLNHGSPYRHENGINQIFEQSLQAVNRYFAEIKWSIKKIEDAS